MFEISLIFSRILYVPLIAYTYLNSDLESVQSDTLLVVADAGCLLLLQTQVHSILNAVARPRYFEHELGVFQQRLIEDEVVVST